MGQKVHPIGIRLGVVKRHNANWYASPKQYAEYLLKDLQVREFLNKKLKNAMISNILIERPTGAAKITIRARSSPCPCSSLYIRGRRP